MKPKYFFKGILRTYIAFSCLIGKLLAQNCGPLQVEMNSSGCTSYYMIVNPGYHKIDASGNCWYHTEWLNRHEHADASSLCNAYNGWVPMLVEDFNPGPVNENLWAAVNGRNGDGERQLFTDFNSSNYEITNNGTLKIKLLGETGDQSIPYQHEFTSGEFISRRAYPAGRYETRFKIKNSSYTNFAPFWLLGRYPRHDNSDEIHFYQEIDVEFISDQCHQRSPTLTYHRQLPTNNPNDNQALDKRCRDGAHYQCGSKHFDDGDWHTMEMDWDPYRIRWSFDGKEYRTIYRTYYLGGINHVNECNGPATWGAYRVNNMMPTFTNMHVMADISCSVGLTVANLPLEMELDYIHAYRKIDCSKTVNLCEFIFAVPNVPPDEEHDMPSVITGGVINVAGNGCNFVYHRDPNFFWIAKHLDLYAATSINLLPGFTADPGAASCGGCPERGGGYV